MSEETTQSVADETNDPAMQGSTEVAGAQDQGGEDAFEAALSEWDSSAKSEASPSSQKDGTQSDDEVSALRQELQSYRQEREQERYRSDISKVVSELRGDFSPNEVDDDFIEAWVDLQARKDPRVATAWLNRQNDPAKFNRTVKALSKEFEKKHARLRTRNEEATADREAVSFAVKGASRSAPEHKQPDYSRMTDQEFANKIQEDYGYRPM